ncbi:MAG: hypothetical protein RLZZ389_835 [Actinomycetota bacterium]
MTTEATTTTGILLTDVAASKVAALLAQEGRDDLNLRNMDGDIVREFGAVKVITDKMSDPYLSGATIDFVDTIEKQGFTIDNPNAQGSCACGDSFN